jgi:hypothetical protein
MRYTPLRKRHFRPSPDEARAYFRTVARAASTPRNAARVQRSRQEEHELHRAQIRADIERAKTNTVGTRSTRVPLMQPS